MIQPVHSFTAEKRRLAVDAANRMGIDDAFIDLLVEDFYGRVRQDERLSPIFDTAIGERWDTHLPKMKAFWGAIVFSDGRFKGAPVPAHVKLKSVTPEDFTLWLGLFRQTLDAIAPTRDARDFLMERAERIAESLKLAMFFRRPTTSTIGVHAS